jgi:hypothetical protein
MSNGHLYDTDHNRARFSLWISRSELWLAKGQLRFDPPPDRWAA